MKEKAKELRRELKALGISNKDVSVRVSPCTYSEAMDVTIKNLSVDIRKVEELALKYERIDRDERSGEILSGGNEFVEVKYDWQILAEESKKYFSAAEGVLKTELEQGKGITISNTDKHKLVFWRGNPNQIAVHNATTFGTVYNNWAKFPAYNKEALAQSLTICHYLYGFNY